MSTRSALVSYIKENDSEKYIACYIHYDGYPSYMGTYIKENLMEGSNFENLVSSSSYYTAIDETDKPDGKPYTYDTLNSCLTSLEDSNIEYLYLKDKNKEFKIYSKDIGVNKPLKFYGDLLNSLNCQS